MAKKGVCWAMKMAKRLAGNPATDYYKNIDAFQPTFHPFHLNEPLHWRKPQRIACCFMGDIACAKDDEINAILGVIQRTPHHRYYIWTKQARKLLGFKFPHNVWLGVTINCQNDIYRLFELIDLEADIFCLSLEPLYESIEFPNELDLIDWIAIGAQTNPVFQPKKNWVDDILFHADSLSIPVFMKDNLKYEPKRYDFPKKEGYF